jgi:hypothetical protein
MKKPKIPKFFQQKLNFNFFYDKIAGFSLKLGPRAARCFPRAGPGSPTSELAGYGRARAGTSRSFQKSRAGTGSGRPNVTGSSLLLYILLKLY